jgi:hypothetical protein
MTEQQLEGFLKDDLVSLKVPVVEDSDLSGMTKVQMVPGFLPNYSVRVPNNRLTLVERTVVLPVNPYDYGPDPETGQPRWQVQSGVVGGWADVVGVTCREGDVWRLETGGGWQWPIGERPVRPVTR